MSTGEVGPAVKAGMRARGHIDPTEGTTQAKSGHTALKVGLGTKGPTAPGASPVEMNLGDRMIEILGKTISLPRNPGTRATGVRVRIAGLENGATRARAGCSTTLAAAESRRRTKLLTGKARRTTLLGPRRRSRVKVSLRGRRTGPPVDSRINPMVMVTTMTHGVIGQLNPELQVLAKRRRKRRKEVLRRELPPVARRSRNQPVNLRVSRKPR